MTILKTIDGDEIDTSQFKSYGQFTKYVQENYDKRYGTSDTKNSSFTVELIGKKTVHAYITVEATTKEQAAKKAKEKAELQDYSVDWEDSINDNTDDIEVIDVEESEDEDDE